MAKRKTTKPPEAAAAIEGLSFPELLRQTADNLTAEAFPVELVQGLLHEAAGQVELLGEIVGLLEERQGLLSEEQTREMDDAIRKSVDIAASVTRFMERASFRKGGKSRTRSTDGAKARTQKLAAQALREGWSASDLERKLALEGFTVGHSTASSWLKQLREGKSLVG